MKKAFLLMAAAILTSLCVACGKSDDEKPEPEDPTPVGAEMKLSFNTTTEMLATLDITISYFNEDGTKTDVKLSETSWNVTVNAPLPAIMGMRVTAALKEGVSPSAADTFKASYSYSYSGNSVSEDGKVAGITVSGGISSELSMKGDKISSWLERHEDGLVHIIYRFYEDGNAAKPEPVG